MLAPRHVTGNRFDRPTLVAHKPVFGCNRVYQMAFADLPRTSYELFRVFCTMAFSALSVGWEIWRYRYLSGWEMDRKDRLR
jgi:hypothetical protein